MVYKWSGCKDDSSSEDGESSILYKGRTERLIIRGFYIIKDEFFEKMNDPYLKGNKQEHRPHYYCFREEKTELFWMIPLSSKVKKYKDIIEKREKMGKNCEILHIAKLDNGKENAFLIQDMFPITEKYIKKAYTIGTQNLLLTSDALANEIEKKARKVYELLKRGVKFTPTQPDIEKIIQKLQDT